MSIHVPKQPSTEERMWAVLAHLSALTMGVGVLLPILGWAEQRRKSKYAAFQCLQALGYQSLGYTVWLLGWLLAMVLFLTAAAFFNGLRGADADTSTPVWTGVLVLIGLGSIGLYLLPPVVGAFFCALGRDFRYPVMGSRLAKYLGYNLQTADEEQTWLIQEGEDRWVAAMGHISVIIPLWGLIAPVAAWMLQGRRSGFVRFQSAQTVAYQVFVNLLYLGSGFIALVGALFLFALTGLESDPGQFSSPTAVTGLAIFLVSMLLSVLILLVLPLFHILGQWAGYRVLKGDAYRYPLAGKVVERWMAGGGPIEQVP